jgi:endonuclease/exonuclease/phosphatase family metal-dependent hydrolase
MYAPTMGNPVAAPTCGPQVGQSEAIRWVHPARDRDVRSLAEWCASVGPPELELFTTGSGIDTGADPELAWAPNAAPASPNLTIVSWNVQGRAGDIEGFLRDELSYDCTGQQGTEHFVMLIQEGVRRSPRVPQIVQAYAPALGPAEARGRPDFVATARRCGLSFVYVPSMRNGVEGYVDGREDRGNAILSSLPLLNPSAIELPFEGQRRVAVMASIEAPASPDTISFVSLHLDSFAGVARALLTGESSKERQVLGLVDALALPDDGERTSPWSSHTILVAGDLNTWSERQTAVQRLVEYFPDSPPVDDSPTRGAFPTDHLFALVREEVLPSVDGDEIRTPIRHLTVDASSYELISDSYLSDHKPRRVRLTSFR